MGLGPDKPPRAFYPKRSLVVGCAPVAERNRAPGKPLIKEPDELVTSRLEAFWSGG